MQSQKKENYFKLSILKNSTAYSLIYQTKLIKIQKNF